MARVGTTLASVAALGLSLAIAGIAGPSVPAFAQQQGQPARAEADKAKAEKAKPQQKPLRKEKKKGAEADASGGEDARKRDSADVQKTLAAAQKSLEGNKADIAVGQIDALIGRGGLDARSMARALSIRGQAYRRQGKPAQAIADLQSALWLKNGLSESERASAMEARAGSYREAGLGEAPGVGGGASAGGQQTNRNVAATAAPAPTRLETAAVPEQRAPAAPAPSQPSAGGGVGSFFSNLFGGGGQQAAPARAAAPPPAAKPSVSSSEVVRADPAETKGKARAKVASAASATGAARPDTPPVAEPAKTEAAPPKADGRGRLALRLSAQRTETDARAVAERVQREHPEAAGRRARVDEAVFGGMGTFYQPSIGPFADMDGAKKLCAAIRGKGVDCEVVTR